MWVSLFLNLLYVISFSCVGAFFSFLKRLFFCTQDIRIPFVSHSLLSVIFRLTFFNGKHLLINDVSILKNAS